MKGRRIRPLGKNVIVVPKEKKEKSDGGIIIPEDAQRPEITGVLLEVGDEVPKKADGTNRFEEKAKVVFPQYTGTELELEDDEGNKITLLVMPYDRVVAVIE